jgi:glutamate dehydrogenase
VLGLVKAQQVKNAVIVPVGAKGGFLPKKVPLNGTRDDIFQNGLAAYKTFIRMLLSVTDNLSGARIIPPANTVRHDGDDPYFVVAADKGTATFSDTANGLAQEADFWLDDAFASGGSAGYDHKKMGITARGAWEAVKRHFREMGTDIQTTPFTVAGVGDMSGDVFGNGMLLSPKIRLIAAFDHRDIFIDPDPDLAMSFSERQRLFALPRSSWQDYDRKALSKGAMIVSRKEKSVTLTEEAAAAIGLQTLTASPSDIIIAILKSSVDLLWFGGIGTYIRAPDESDADVGDRANDAVRITGDAVQAKVIGEGANLGVTARGRIAYGLKGGRCNSDAIDNSAGVNSSDIEVNIKIALSNPLRDNRLTRANRDVLLASMTDEVAALVLRNNYLQTLSISLTEREGLNNGRALSHLMHDLEVAGTLNREVEFLPDDKTMSGRYLAGKPLTRSEIAILLSYAKMDLFDRLIASTLPDDPWLEEALIQYFPEKMQRIYESDILNHRLRREIIATVLANHVINRGGPAFLSSMQRKTGAEAQDIVKAAIYICDGFDLASIWNELDQLDGHVTGDIQNSLYALVADFYAHAIENTVNSKAISDQALTPAIKALKQAIASLNQTIQSLLPVSVNEDLAKREGALTDQGVSAALASRLARLETLVSIPEMAKVSVTDQVSLADAASHYLRVSEDYGIEKILFLGRQVRAGDPYEEQALSTCMSEIATARSVLVSSALKQSAEERLAHAQGRSLPKENDFFKEDLKRLADQPDFSLAKIVVASGLLNQLARNAVK